MITLLVQSSVFAGGGWATSAVRISVNGASTYNYKLNNEGWTNGDWGSNTSFGDINFGTVTSLVLQGAAGNAWTDDSPGYTAASFKLYYRVYAVGNTPGEWNTMNLDFLAYSIGNNRIYDKSGANIDIMALAGNSSGTYTLEVAMSKIQFYSGGEWNSMIPGGQATGYSAAVSGYMGTFTIAALPVELSSFTAINEKGSVRLNWTTATEQNNLGFDVERKNGEGAWTKIAFVDGAGSSNSVHNYSYTDKNALNGKYSYRLKQTDTDGKFKYSQTVEVNANTMPEGFVVEQNYPNPFNPATTIRFGFDKPTDASLTVYDQLGRQVAVLFNGQAEASKMYSVEFNGSSLTSGIYFYKLQTPEKSQVRRMMLVK